MRNARCFLIVLCILLSLGADALWVTGWSRINLLAYDTDHQYREWRITWGAGRVSVTWTRFASFPLRGPHFFTWPERFPGEAQAQLHSLHNFLGFGCDLGLYHVEVWGGFVIPCWFLMLGFGAYPLWRAYRRFGPTKWAHSFNGFNPIMDSKSPVAEVQLSSIRKIIAEHYEPCVVTDFVNVRRQ